MNNGTLKLIKIGDEYINLDRIVRIEIKGNNERITVFLTDNQSIRITTPELNGLLELSDVSVREAYESKQPKIH